MLYILPNVLHESQNPLHSLPVQIQHVVESLDGLICENEKKARQYLKNFSLKMPIQDFPLLVLNEHTKNVEELLEPLTMQKSWGLLSDAGLACIADPGSLLVRLAHKKRIPVQVLHGPCSITATLQLSGMSGQSFSFWGYLPRESDMRKKELVRLEGLAKKYRQTQIFIETPYRNLDLVKDAISVLAPTTTLCIACDIDGPDQEVHVKTIAQYKKGSLPNIYKRPAVFCLQ